MEGLDATIIATSLPQIAHAMNVPATTIGVTLTAYLISVSMWMAASGWLADRFEARRVFVLAIMVFALGTAVCGFSANLAQLVTGRFIQGMGGAMMTPVGRLILARSFPRDQLVQAMSYMIVPGLMGPLLGPVVGGWITSYLDWRWIFFANLPLALGGMALAMRFLDRMPATQTPRFDWWGFALVALALVAFQAGLEAIAEKGAFTGVAQLGVAVALVAMAAYWRHAGRPDPILDFRLMRYRTFAVAVLGGAWSRIVLGATMFLFPLYFQLGLGASPIEAGYLMAALAIGQIALRLVLDPLRRRLGIRLLLIGNCIALAAMLLLFLPMREGISLWLLGAFLFGFGMLQAIQLSLLGALNFSGIPATELGRATSLAAVAQRLAMAAGISLCAIMLGHTRAGATIPRGSFSMPLVALAAMLVLSALSFRFLREGDGDDLIDRR